METNNIWGQYWLILLFISPLIIKCIRDESIDKFISRIPKDKWDKYSHYYKLGLMRYGNSQIDTNKQWFIGITVGLFFITGAIGDIGLQRVASFLIALMLIIVTVIIMIKSKVELEQCKYKFNIKEIIFILFFSLLPFVYKIGCSLNIEILDVVRFFVSWLTYWLLFRYIPLKVCVTMIWLIEFSKRLALKEADKENALRNFLRFIIVIIAGVGIDNINKAVDIKKLLSDVCYNWFFFLLGGEGT